jgi:DNA-binding XRE family transcriptional regulator
LPCSGDIHRTPLATVAHPSVPVRVARKWHEAPSATAATTARAGAIRLAFEIRALREKKGLSQRQLAELVGTTQPAIACLEGGRVSPSLLTLDRIAAALGAEAPSPSPTPPNWRHRSHANDTEPAFRDAVVRGTSACSGTTSSADSCAVARGERSRGATWRSPEAASTILPPSDGVVCPGACR